MRCWSCDGGGTRALGRGGRDRPRALALALSALLGACTTRAVSFEPTTHRGLLGVDDARAQLTESARAECPRLVRERRPSAEARFDLALDSAGVVRRATIVRSSGDDRVDADFGLVAAAMRLPPPAAVNERGEASGRVRMAYTCAGDGPGATVEVL
jgi:hypothetical protein